MNESMNYNNYSYEPPLLECRGLYKSYGSFPALNGIDLRVSRGRIIGLLGTNGSGKTTLMKLVAGLLTPTSGELYVNGNEIGVESKKVVSYLPERTYFDGSMRVIDTVNYFSDFYRDFSRDMALDLIERLGVPIYSKFKNLSKGTKEKLQLILVMSRDAELYLLDEPIGGVDPASRDFILDVILGSFNRRGSIILSTHLIYDIERVLDDAVIIANGGIFLADSCENIRKNTGKTVDMLFREVFRC